MSFFDMDDILSSQQKIQCTFEKSAPKLGFFDPNSKSDDIDQGAKIDLPNWLARELQDPKKSIVSIEIPRSYGSSYRTILNADAHVVDLHKLGPYFYTSGIDLILYGTPETRDLGKTLVQTFTGRFRWLMDKGMNAGGEDKPHLMDKAELKLYATAQAAARSYVRWVYRESELISATEGATTKKMKY